MQNEIPSPVNVDSGKMVSFRSGVFKFGLNMVSFTCLFFVAWGFYLLARKHKRIPALVAIIGIAFYLAVDFGLNYSYRILVSAQDWIISPDLEPLIELLLIVLNIVLTGVLYLLLKRYWERNVLTEHEDLLDQ
ncbi:MAG: hypothetical protein A3D31_02450 [Candidatus Fluviicola riflensis]|nr:MAG: hypothetical protein CHH17_12590 [Candidatus Fluviicola riflensis]OGS78852.1 MAG: hypothetical protein A3D31_02450 [Candidatus Fluviicola riflensis]OGS85874.1 MAG: hypothetical protein A3E30_09935 [Fluviicola sp. RIFCSPHIGHO2_12_FULL_43_24]OGS86283.1 MAG: hypothetical protein A2724_01905 [Fluviicola sp. RIFCSPHIGHO2_01_FULL_43_53]